MWENGTKDTLEHSQKQNMCGTESLASAQMLHPNKLLVPYFRWTRLGLSPARMHRNKTQKGDENLTRTEEGCLRLLDIMAEIILLNTCIIYSRKQTMTSSYNKTRVTMKHQDKCQDNIGSIMGRAETDRSWWKTLEESEDEQE